MIQLMILINFSCSYLMSMKAEDLGSLFVFAKLFSLFSHYFLIIFGNRLGSKYLDNF